VSPAHWNKWWLGKGVRSDGTRKTETEIITRVARQLGCTWRIGLLEQNSILMYTILKSPMPKESHDYTTDQRTTWHGQAVAPINVQSRSRDRIASRAILPQVFDIVPRPISNLLNTTVNSCVWVARPWHFFAALRRASSRRCTKPSAWGRICSGDDPVTWPDQLITYRCYRLLVTFRVNFWKSYFSFCPLIVF
jgi:hypothetical protein